MTKHLQILCATTCIWLLASSPATLALEKWSRQLEATEPGISDSFDWIPLAQPADSSSSDSSSSTAASVKDRSANGRVLTYSQAFPPNGRFGDFAKGLNAPVSQKPSPFDFPYQFQNFGNVPQAQPLRQSNGGVKSQNYQSQDPTSQSFFKFEMPLNQQNSRLNSPQLGGAGSGVNTGYQISHAFGGGAQATLFNSPLFNQQPVFPPEFHPIPQKPQTQQLQQKPLSQQNFIEDSLSLKNFFKEHKPTQASPLQAVTPQVFPQGDGQADVPFSLRSPFNTLPSAAAPSAPSQHQQQQQDLQYLYVPYNDIFNQAPQAQAQSPFEQPPKYNNNLPTVNPYQINQFYTPDPINAPLPPQPNYYTTTTTTIKPQTTSAKPSNIFQNFVNPQYNTTPKPKPKAHQPPLAMFLLRSSARPTQTDVVQALSSSKSIAVIDAPTQNTPDIFVGPSGMPIPNGYTKFDLPYLSQLQGNQDINDVSFFVAPLSYRTPQGYNKILLPEPHVGSIVVNLSKSAPIQQTPSSNPNLYYQPPQLIEEIQQTTQRPRTSTQRVKAHHNNGGGGGGGNNRGNKYSYYFDQDPIQEVTSPQVTQKDRPKKKRPQSVKTEQPSYSTQQLNNPYAQFNPIPNQITTDEYYKLQTKPSTTSSTSTTSTTSTTTSTTSAPQTYFAYNSQPQVDFPGSSGLLYPNINQVSPQPKPEKPKLTTRPPQSTTTAEEEYRMKQYYRQQEAIRNRPEVVAQTNSPYEQVQYTPVDLEYEISKTTTSTTQKPRITFFSPTAAPIQNEEDYNTLPPRQQQQHQPPQQHQINNNLPSNHRPSYIQNEITDSPVEYEPNPYQLPSELPQLTANLPGLVNNLKDQQEQTTLPPQINYEQESSTRPTRRPINRTRKPVATRVTSSVSYSESESTSRRPTQRVRRPFGTRNTASTVSSINTDYDEPTATTTTRRPSYSSSARNPLIRNPNRIRYQPTPEERQTLRVKPKKKYNGSSKIVKESEDIDYQRDVLNQNYPVFRPNTSRKPGSSPTAIPSTYDVTTTEVPTSETQQVYTVTPSNSIDNGNSNRNSNNDQTFPAGLLEPMQIAQQYNEYRDNYGPGYFPNQEDFNPTEAILRNEINPVYTTLPSSTPAPPTTTSTTTTTTTTTTTEAPVELTTRRSPFIRRNYPRLRTTTAETPTTTTPALEDKPSTRNRLPPRKVIKVRARTRRPLHPASSTQTPEEENEATEQPRQNYRRFNRYQKEEEAEATEQPKQNTYRKLNRFNQDLQENNETPRRRYKQKFQLEGQESQWSPPVKVGPTNNFKPINPKDSNKLQHKFENEPEIVTAGPEGSNDGKENYEIEVSANYGPSKSQLKEPNLKPEKSFAELLEEVMGKTPEEKPVETTISPETQSTASDGTVFESQKTTIANRILRRGKWKKTRVSSSSSSSSSSSNGNGESFETAESQNLGSQLFNSLQSKVAKSNAPVDIMKDWKTTTPMTTAAEINAMSTTVTTTPMPSSMEEYAMSTSKALEITTIATTLPMDVEGTQDEESSTTNEESATRRMDMDDMAMEDDLEIQPSLFSEVKKQLHELFSIEESDDTAVTAALAAVGKRRQEYTNIKRPKVETTTDMVPITEPMSLEDKKAFHRELMKHVVYATSSPVKQEETSEAEICYRGRCIKSDDLPLNHKLN